MKKGDLINIGGKNIEVSEVRHNQTVYKTEDNQIVIGTKNDGFNGFGELGNAMAIAQVSKIASENPEATKELVTRAGDVSESIVDNYFGTVKTIAVVGGVIALVGMVAIGTVIAKKRKNN